MKITHNKVGQNLNTADAKSPRAEGADVAAKTDKVSGKQVSSDKAAALMNSELGSSSKVNVSTRAQDMKKIKDVATAAPDVDEAKVARLQKMIDEGTYKVSAKDIADKMVDDQANWG